MELNTRKLFIKLIGKTAVLLFISLSFNCLGQETRNAFFIKFKDKTGSFTPSEHLSTKSIERRSKFNINYDLLDYPVSPRYIKAILADSSISIRYALKWHNAIVVDSKDSNLNFLLAYPFVQEINYVGKTKKVQSFPNQLFIQPIKKLKESTISTRNLSKEDYGVSYKQNKQIGTTVLHQQGFDGEGIYIAVFDAGFHNLDKIPAFLKHQANAKIYYGLDVVDMDLDLVDRDNHGTAVSSCVGAFDKGKYIGGAPQAKLLLFRTEKASSEYPLEELNWCKAAELADSFGVDLITSSLGYTTYDENNLSYQHEDLDGKTSYISLAAKTAVDKGIFVLNSAGNEGDKTWRKVGTPADAPEVLTIGAVDLKNRNGSFSSQGNNASGIIKPDVAALGVRANVASSYGTYYQGYGTSYSTPIAAGGVACILQAFPKSSPKTIANAIRLSATNNINPDSLMGYGVARLDLAYQVLSNNEIANPKPYIISIDDKSLILYSGKATNISYTLLKKKKWLWVFHKNITLIKGETLCNSTISHITLDDFSPACVDKYTLKVSLFGDVENYKLRNNKLSICTN